MRLMNWTLAALLAGSLVACGDDDDGGSPDANAGTGFTQPANTVVVNFVVDDSVNKDWKAGELEWKGQFQFDPATRIATFSSDWLAQTPGWAKLYDDGPWNTGTAATAGHEPKGSVAGDNKWGVAVFVQKPAAGADLTVGYGLRDATNPDRENGGWVWLGASAGSITITSTSTEINAPGQTFPAKGTTDLKLVIDKNNIEAGFTTNTIKVKGSGWGWSEKDMFDDGTNGDDTAADGKYTFVVSQGISRTTPPYPGLFKTGDKPEWVFVLGGTEYKNSAKESLKTGVTAFTKAMSAASFTAVTVSNTPASEFGTNLTVTVP